MALPVSIPSTMVTGMPGHPSISSYAVSDATAYAGKQNQDGNNFYYPIFHKQ